MTVDQEARDMAQKALHRSETHEEVCAIRYEGIQNQFIDLLKAQTELTQTITRLYNWRWTMAVSVIIGLISVIGFLLRPYFGG